MYDPFAAPPMQMYPGGNPGGAPVQQNPGGPVAPALPGHPRGLLSLNNAFAGLMGPQWQGYHTALTDWRGLRPSFQGVTPTSGGPQDFRSAMMDWRQQRPTFRSYLSAQTPTTGMTTNPNAGI